MASQRDTFLVEMGRRLRRRRDDLQVPQYEVAAAVGLDVSSYSLLEAGKRQRIKPQQLAQLAQVLHTSSDYLLQLSDDRGVVPDRYNPEEGLTLRVIPPLPA